MKIEEMQQWCLEHSILFTANKRPTQEEFEMVFYIANQVDPTQTHKPTTCGRCWGNAKRAIKRQLDIFQ